MGQAVRTSSEIRTQTLRKISSKRTNQQQLLTLDELEQQLDSEWFRLKRTRHEVGRILSQVKTVLVDDGAFSDFLRRKGIPRSTAYDLIRDYARWAKLPALMQESAKRLQIDLAERKYTRAIEQELEDIEPGKLDPGQADELVRRIDLICKRNQCEPIRLNGLDDDSRRLTQAFQAVNGLIGGETSEDRARLLGELLGYVLHTFRMPPGKVIAKPAQPPVWLFTGVGEGDSE